MTNHALREISLVKLTQWSGNVRKTAVETGIDELAASIAAHGLINPLTICSAPKGKFVVVAGQRRLLALKKLAKDGTIPKTHPVACTMRDDDTDPAELSLAENVVRVAMHPADQFTAWSGLIENGATVDEVAARFGVAASTVRKRMALARVSPRIFALYREGEIELEALQAFTISDDHERQDAVFDGMAGWQRNDPRAIRQALTEGEVPSSDRRARFVGIEAYEAAGGTVRRDLFDAREGGFLQDVALLDRLTVEKLHEVAAEVKAEGWLWTEARLSFDWTDRQEFDEAEAEFAPEGDGDEDDDSALSWSHEAKAIAGAVVCLSYSGEAVIERGLIRPGEIEPEADEGNGATGNDDEDADAISGPAALPASLIEELTAQRTASLRIELARCPETALALVVHTLAADVFYNQPKGILKAWITQRSLRTAMKDHDAALAVMALNDERDRIGDLLPGDRAGLWDWCMNASQTQLLDVLAVATAHGLDAVESKNDQNRFGTAEGATLSGTLKLDMAQWYRPTAAGYFGRIGKAAIMADLEAMRNAPPAPSWAKLKKGELAALAEREAEAHGWMPPLLR
ncbi:ParB/RepB/Spo0J family partition protein [Methylobacterium sp. E-065]|uniref:ParB/RepB/Spo0J family partition protein n=1 Tax=Methylobacterium sp. E-065 TaxID=2836583 RepID=UPI001FBB3601|nr:ParB/RepB/Spo0J family partition protein [Methylobacterium sp. E-065]MCJ2015890.1 ParB/RepB/Spo0J family partition protein [Methylobacterium sp. E-065]